MTLPSDLPQDSPPAWDLAELRHWLSAGEPLRAFERSEAWPPEARDAAFFHLQALALARTGATGPALARLERALASGQDDPEALGLRARLFKDRADQSAPGERASALRRARDAYADVHRRFPGLWPAINAATLSLALGEGPEARAFAKTAQSHARQEPAEDLWAQATLGDAALILGADAEAHAAYAQVWALGAGRWGDLAAVRRNVLRILSALRRGPEALASLLPTVRVGVFSGHRVDASDRPSPRFPATAVALVAAALAEAVRGQGLAFGVASAANGGDLLFLEAVLEAGGLVHVVLPCAAERFRPVSVGEDPAWTARFDRVLAGASQVTVVSQGGDPLDPALLRLTNEILLGLGRLKAAEWATDLRALALWAPGSEGGGGGTAEALAAWIRAGEHPWGVGLGQVEGGLEVTALAPLEAPAVEDPSGLGAKPFLFADVKGFSRLGEAQIPVYVERFLGGVAAFAARRTVAPLARGTWGDALFFGFDTLEEGGAFALDLAAWMRVQPWSDWGLPADFGLRMALHLGPVTAVRDPITGLDTFFGSALVRAARMEPITPPGEVYASQEFAALAAVRAPGRFRCDYVGHVPLPKGYGTFPVYHLRPG